MESVAVAYGLGVKDFDDNSVLGLLVSFVDSTYLRLGETELQRLRSAAYFPWRSRSNMYIPAPRRG